MATYNGPLTRPPAREALIDIQFAPDVPREVVESFAQATAPRFERMSPMFQAAFGFMLGPSAQAQQPPPPLVTSGYRLESSNPPHVVNCRTGGYTFSRLAPYSSWDELRGAAKREWDEFSERLGDAIVRRIAVRYINELKLPMPLRDFSEYLTCPPDIPDVLPQAVTSFLQRVVIPDVESDCVSIVNQVLEGPPPAPGAPLPVILDIDVFRVVEIPVRESERIWNGLDQLRVQKNKMFFAHITDRLVEQFR